MRDDPGKWGQCVDCSEPQWSRDCSFFAGELLAPAITACGKPCGGNGFDYSFDEETSTYSYIDHFESYNSDMWNSPGFCSDGYNDASYVKDGKMTFAIDDWWDNGDYYGGCVYSKKAFKYGNFTARIRGGDNAYGTVPSFYTYSEASSRSLADPKTNKQPLSFHPLFLMCCADKQARRDRL